jgi:hypothetical protein
MSFRHSVMSMHALPSCTVVTGSGAGGALGSVTDRCIPEDTADARNDEPRRGVSTVRRRGPRPEDAPFRPFFVAPATRIIGEAVGPDRGPATSRREMKDGTREPAGLPDGMAWRDTPLGPPDTWPERPRTMVGLVLRCPAASCLFWGPDGRMIYNDAWAADLGPLHPQALWAPAVRLSPDLARAHGAALQAAAAGATPEIEGPLLPVMWRSLVDRPSASLSCTPVMGDADAADGLLVQLSLVGGHERHNARSGAPAETVRRNAFMLRLSDALRQVEAPDEVQALGTRMLGEELDADGATLTEVDLGAGIAWERCAYRRDGAATPAAAPQALSDYEPAIDLLRNGLSIMLDDIGDAAAGPSGAVAAEVLRYARTPHRAQLSVPIRAAATWAVATSAAVQRCGASWRTVSTDTRASPRRI